MSIHPPRLILVEHKGYLGFNYLVERAKVFIIDSSGITEETTVKGVPCMTLRDNTLSPQTVVLGTNELIGADSKVIKPALLKIFKGEWKLCSMPHKWYGHYANRIIDIFARLPLN